MIGAERDLYPPPFQRTRGRTLVFFLALLTSSLIVRFAVEAQYAAFRQMRVHLPPGWVLCALKVALAAACTMVVGSAFYEWRRRRHLRRIASEGVVSHLVQSAQAFEHLALVSQVRVRDLTELRRLAKARRRDARYVSKVLRRRFFQKVVDT